MSFLPLLYFSPQNHACPTTYTNIPHLREPKSSRNRTTERICTICLENILEKGNSSNVSLLPKKIKWVGLKRTKYCGHSYHKECLESSIRFQINNEQEPNCCVCRTKVKASWLKKNFPSLKLPSSYQVDSPQYTRLDRERTFRITPQRELPYYSPSLGLFMFGGPMFMSR